MGSEMCIRDSREAAKQFQLGLQAGAQMAKGFIPKFRGEEEPASDDE